MTHFTATELIAAAKAYIAADAEIMTRRPQGCPRAAWRMQNPIEIPIAFAAKEGRAKRSLAFDLNGNPYDLWVWSTGANPAVLERIDLKAADADARLACFLKI